jgi:nitric oxide reductase NorQ protein
MGKKWKKVKVGELQAPVSPAVATGNGSASEIADPAALSEVNEPDETDDGSNSDRGEGETVIPETKSTPEENRKEVLRTIASQVLVGPRHRWPSRPNWFSVDENSWRQLCLTVNLGHNGLLMGPTGSGKSLLIRLLSRAMRRPWFSFNFGGILDPRNELLGSTQLRNGETVFLDAQFLQAVQTPEAIVVLDEINRCEGMFLNLLTPLLDGHRFLTVGERLHSPVVEVAEGVTFFGIANLGPEYAHTVPLDRAILDRFHSTIHIEYPEHAEELRLVLEKYPRLDRESISNLITLVGAQRKLAMNDEYGIYISTRMVFAVAEMVNYGIDLWQAIEFGMTSKLNDSHDQEGSERERFRLMVQKFLWR